MSSTPCPFHSRPLTMAAGGGRRHCDWWLDQLNLEMLSQQSGKTGALDAGFDCVRAFAMLDLDAVAADPRAPMANSQDRWPADCATAAAWRSV